MTGRVPVDVVIVTYRSRPLLERLLAEVTSVVDGRLVVVDNGDDGSADLAAERGADVIRRPDNPGFGTAQNAGFQRTSAPFVLLLNPDARPLAGGIAAAAGLLAADPTVGAVQGAVLDELTGRPERSHGRELGWLHLVGRALGLRRVARLRAARALARRTRFEDHVERQVAIASEVETLAATAVLVRREAFDSVGGFDEGYFLYGEDLDLCRRLRRAGWRLVALPEPMALHRSGSSSESWRRRELEWWRGTMRFAARWWSSGSWRLAQLAAVLRWMGLVLRQPAGTVEAWWAVIGDARSVRRETRGRPGAG